MYDVEGLDGEDAATSRTTSTVVLSASIEIRGLLLSRGIPIIWKLYVFSSACLVLKTTRG